MSVPESRHEVRHAAEMRLRAALASLRPDLPADAIAVEDDEQGLMSAQVYGVEQALQRHADALQSETVQRFSHARPLYRRDEIDALLKTLHIIASKAGLPLPPGALALIELPGGVLVLTWRHRLLASSEDPLHLLSQALRRLTTAAG
ncbi:hypothetical protein GCM10023144_40210 [Pigmentiphaga soli]|uniref:Uncharacterized protein n=1 Tax=Pigmentiphaga soli TaxID=1007095 RepID=A0ABP8HL73_9BURK